MRRTLFILTALLLLAGPSWAIPPFPPGGGTTAGVSDTAYNETTWDGVTDTAPSKNAVRDKFFSVDAALALKQTSHANLTSASGLTYSEGSFVAMTGANTFALRTYAQVLSDIGAAASGHNHDGTYQAASANLTTFAGIAPSANVLTLLGAADFAAFRTSLSLVPGTNIMAYNAYLADLAGLTPAAGDILYFDGSNWKVLLAGTANYYLKCNGAAAPSWGNTFTGTFGGFYTISGTTTGDGAGDGTTVIDATALGSYADDWYNGGTILVTSGDASGESRTISDFATTTGTVTVSSAFSVQITTGTTYKIRLNNTPITANSSGELAQGYCLFDGPTKPRKFTLPDSDAPIVTEGNATGGLLFGDSSPDAAGEIGYASGKFLMYGANSEDVYINVGSAANTVTVGTNTGVTDLSLGAINLLTTGTIAGRVPIGSDITGNISLNTTDLIGKVYFVTAACTITLDKVSDVGYGAVVGFYVRDASETCTIEVDDADKIKLYGKALDAGDTIDSPGAAGDYIFLMSVTDADGSGTDGWVTFGGSGTWKDGGAT